MHSLCCEYFTIRKGKSGGNSKDICGDDKFKEDGDPWNVEAQAAFLGPNLWDKTLPYDTDLKVTHVSILSLPPFPFHFSERGRKAQATRPSQTDTAIWCVCRRLGNTAALNC